MNEVIEMLEVQIDYTAGEYVESVIVPETRSDDELIELAERGYTILDIIEL